MAVLSLSRSLVVSLPRSPSLGFAHSLLTARNSSHNELCGQPESTKGELVSEGDDSLSLSFALLDGPPSARPLPAAGVRVLANLASAAMSPCVRPNRARVHAGFMEWCRWPIISEKRTEMKENRDTCAGAMLFSPRSRRM